MSKDAKEKIIELVERFERNLDVYTRGSYNETQVRREFIDPFFQALGWDVDNRMGHAEQYKDVVHEDSLKVGATSKAPDYSFRIGGQRKFFLEAKKPSVNIRDDLSPAFQLRRYAWSARLPLSILTDFEELAVYDCRIKPKSSDKVSVGRIAYYTFHEYVKKFDEIYGIFSKDAVLKGSFDRYAEEKLGKRGTAEVDREFLKEIESWRDSLARNIALRNRGLSVHELNFAVQHTIDRIIFLRICEDRGIEHYERLRTLLNGTNTYARLLEDFHRADDKFNSGLFDFTSDTLTPGLKIDDKILKGIIENLYYPKSPYEFSMISADILGNVYEQFLGKVIRLTSGHQAKVEEKPEVKKAGGVYYTPKYIVDYIVLNTVGRLLENSTPKKAAKLRILDPACGSGSFLIGAYSYLLAWHLDWYTENNPDRHAKGKRPSVYRGRGGGWRLTTSEKKRILINNIYGVDIDRQAVEVTKLSLLLRVLEDESGETLGQTLKLFNERALPNLKDNIKCGNSLVGPDFYSQMTLDLDDEEARRINVFDWNDDEKGFGTIMKARGFDAVIGNPPYVRQEMLGAIKPYLQAHYATYNGVADLYVYFIEKGVSLLNEGGLFSYIVANKWMRANYGEPLRRWMREQALDEIVDFGDLRVFQQATTYPCIMRIGKGKAHKSFHATKVDTLDFTSLWEYVDKNHYDITRNTLNDHGWSLASEIEAALLDKIKSFGITLAEFVDKSVHYGIKTGLNKAFVIDGDTKEYLIKEDPKSKELIKPFLIGKNIRRYNIEDSNKHLIFIPKGWTIEHSESTSDAWPWFLKNYPAVAKHLSQFKSEAERRYDKGDYWWELRTCEYYDAFDTPKIMYLVFQVKPAFTFDKGGIYANNAVWIIPKDNKYLLGILNSRLGWFLISRYCTQIQGGYQLIFKYLGQIPIRTIDFSERADKARHDRMVSLVERMLDLNKKLQGTKTPHDRELIERRIKATDNEIDALVYELYGLTDEEIRIVEGDSP